MPKRVFNKYFAPSDGSGSEPAISRRGFLKAATSGGVLLPLAAIPSLVPLAPCATADAPPSNPVKSRAIVIGIDEIKNKDKYPELQKLDRPREDAAKFARWLISKKCGVKPADVNLLLGPIQQPVPGVTANEASGANILRAINDCLKTSEQERLYFYYSGHGCSVREQTPRQGIIDIDAIYPWDYEQGVAKPIDARWTLAFLSYCSFKQQFFAFDCCRTENKNDDLASGDKVPIGHVSLAGKSAHRQYILYATLPGLPAFESVGLFSDQLVTFLTTGQGKSKFYDPMRQKYFVTWDKMAEALRSYFEKKNITIGNDTLQIEVKTNPSSTIQNVALSDVGTNFPNIDVTVRVDPPVAGGPTVVVEFTPVGASVDNIRPQKITSDGQAATFSVPPRDYNLKLSPQGVQDYATWSYSYGLYDTGPIDVPLMKKSDVREVSVVGDASVLVQLQNSSRWIEVRDDVGQPIPTMAGRVFSHGRSAEYELKPGAYRLLAGLWNGGVDERQLEVAAGSSHTVSFTDHKCDAGKYVTEPGYTLLGNPPLPGLAASEVLRSAFKRTTMAEGFGTFEWIVQPAYLDFPTIISRLIQGVGNTDSRSATLEDLGLVPFETTTGIRLVIGFRNKLSEEQTKSYRLEFQRFGEPAWKPAERMPSKDPSMAVFATSAAPGSYRLRMTLLGRTMFCAVSVLRRRVTNLIIYANRQGGDTMLQFMPTAGGPAQPRRFDGVLRDVLQREVQAGRAGPEATLSQLKSSGPLDPISGCIELYLHSALAEADQLKAEALSLIQAYPELPDAHVALARAIDLTSRQPSAAAQREYALALDCGVPLMSHFLTHLAAGLNQHGAKHKNSKSLLEAQARSVPLSFWSTWIDK